MAPETKKRELSNKIDIYSLGVITFEMARGPFVTQSERLMELSEIRKPEINFPKGVFQGEKM